MALKEMIRSGGNPERILSMVMAEMTKSMEEMEMILSLAEQETIIFLEKPEMIRISSIVAMEKTLSRISMVLIRMEEMIVLNLAQE